MSIMPETEMKRNSGELIRGGAIVGATNHLKYGRDRPGLF